MLLLSLGTCVPLFTFCCLSAFQIRGVHSLICPTKTCPRSGWCHFREWPMNIGYRWVQYPKSPVTRLDPQSQSHIGPSCLSPSHVGWRSLVPKLNIKRRVFSKRWAKFSGTCLWMSSPKMPKLSTKYQKHKNTPGKGWSVYFQHLHSHLLKGFQRPFFLTPSISQKQTSRMAFAATWTQNNSAQHSCSSAPGHCAAWDLSKASRDVRRQHSSSPGHRSLTGHRMLQSLTWRRYENHRIQKCQMDKIGVMVDKLTRKNLHI